MSRVVPFTSHNTAYAVGLMRELVELSSFKTVPFDWEHSLRSVRAAMDNDTYYLRMSQDDNDEYTGLVAGYVTPLYFAPRLIAVESAWYVREGSQDRTKMAAALMRSFMSWALDEKHAVHVQSGDIANIHPAAVDALYRHLGFKRVGLIFKYER